MKRSKNNDMYVHKMLGGHTYPQILPTGRAANIRPPADPRCVPCGKQVSLFEGEPASIQYRINNRNRFHKKMLFDMMMPHRMKSEISFGIFGSRKIEKSRSRSWFYRFRSLSLFKLGGDRNVFLTRPNESSSTGVPSQRTPKNGPNFSQDPRVRPPSRYCFGQFDYRILLAF
jgi:hypothetical protein